MTKTAIVSSLVLFAAISAAPAVGQDMAAAARANVLLERENAVARQPVSYVIFDLAGRTVRLKSKGMILKEWTLAGTRTWGRPVPIKIYELVRKSALNPPERTNITPKPGAPQPAGDVDLGVLEIGKMPSSYTLELADGIRIRVRKASSGLGAVLKGAGRLFRRQILLPLRAVAAAVVKKPFTEFELILPEVKAAQGIYWAFFEGQKCIIFE